jgi:hypothetical protein
MVITEVWERDEEDDDQRAQNLSKGRNTFPF